MITKHCVYMSEQTEHKVDLKTYSVWAYMNLTLLAFC
jgi:hypothetical protein